MGRFTYIADDTTGSALAGTTKTFDAKTGTELNEDYRSGYFPVVSSHSLTMDIDGGVKNVFTFIYVAKPEVTYTVKYLEKGTEKQLADPKTVTTRDAVVTGSSSKSPVTPRTLIRSSWSWLPKAM